MSGVKVLRILEYTYEDQESADRDKMRWGVPPNGAFEGGVRRYQGHTPTTFGTVVIRSATIEYPFGEPLTEDKINRTMAAVGSVVGDGSAPSTPAEA